MNPPPTRPSKPKKHRPSDDRPGPVAVRLSHEEYAALEAAAKGDGIGKSAKARRLIAAGLGLPVPPIPD